MNMGAGRSEIRDRDGALRRLAIVCVIVFLVQLGAHACRCHNPPSRKIARLGQEKVLYKFGKDETVNASMVAGISEDRALVAWSMESGTQAMFINAEGRKTGEIFQISKEKAKTLHGALEQCAGRKPKAVLLAVPTTSPVLGNKPLSIVSINPDHSVAGKPIHMGEAGPYSKGGAIVAACNRAYVAWHTGKVGEFNVNAAAVDLDTGKLIWEKTVSRPGLNAFGPSIIKGKGRIAVAWVEKKLVIGKTEAEHRQGDVRLSILDHEGRYILEPVSVARTFLPVYAPAIGFDGEDIMFVFKDHPDDEYRAGLYFMKTSASGKILMNRSRLARADGPDSPLLLKLRDKGLATFVLRGLADDLLVGVNFMGREGTKLQRELQIYAHGVKYKNISAVLLGSSIIAVYAGCDLAGCSLFSIDIDLSAVLN